MPRQSKKQAEDSIKENIIAKWRLLLRNPDFQKDIQTLSEIYRDKDVTITSRDELKEAVADKYELLSIPGSVIIYWPGIPLEREDFEELERCLTFLPYPDYSPVLHTDLVEDRFLFLRLDLSHPIQALLPLIEAELRSNIKNIHGSRRRLDKLTEQLFVYDNAITGIPFKEISERLHRKISTVKSMFFSISKKIHQQKQPSGKRQLEKKHILEGFNVETHMQVCGTCQIANIYDELCDAAKFFINQDSSSQRELTGTFSHKI